MDLMHARLVSRTPELLICLKSLLLSFSRSYAMQYIPRYLRPVIYRFVPAMATLQKTVDKANAIVEPEIKRRTNIAAKALANGERLPKHLDTIDWMMETANGRPYDITAGQLSLTFAAIHTTSTTSTHLMYDIIENGLTDELRHEIIDVYREDGGWAKTSLYKLKLLDSVMKESQRINCLSASKCSNGLHSLISI